MIAARRIACLALVFAAAGCEPWTPPGATPASGSGSGSASASGSGAGPGAAAVSARASGRPPTFVARASAPLYERALEGMHAIDSMRGSAMTESLATDLGFKCADLKELRGKLQAEPDPQVWRLRSRIDKTCSYDVPIASALLELDAIQKKRAADASADLGAECRALKLALADLGTGYLANPTASDVIGKDSMYCGATDSVRRVP